MQAKRILAFVKYGTEEHMRRLQQGELFFNTLQYFTGCDPSLGRGDAFENVYKQTIGPGIVMNLQEELHHTKIDIVRLPNGQYISKFINTEFFANYFCLYTVVSEQDLQDQVHNLSTEMVGFGEYMLIIFFPGEFMRRAEELIKPQVDRYHAGGIQYVNIGELNGRKDYFKKPLRYSYQKEYRFAFKNGKEEARTFNIGSIEDISVLMPSSKCKGVQFILKQSDLQTRVKSLLDRHVKDYEFCFDAFERYSQQIDLDPAKLKVLQAAVITSRESMLEFLSMIKYKTD